MDFGNRIKKELSQGIVRALLIDAGYRVLDFGIESLVREIQCLTALEHRELEFPKALRAMPDLLVMNRDQTSKYLVEIKFRTGWSRHLLEELEEQVKIFKELVLVYINSEPGEPPDSPRSPSTYLRCCRLAYKDEVIQAEVRMGAGTEPRWVSIGDLESHHKQWWGLRPIQEVFPKIDERKKEGTLVAAINAISGIIKK